MSDNKRKTLDLTNRLLESIELAMDDNGFEMEWYIDLQKGETVFISNLLDEDEALREMIENDFNEERFVAIPSRTSHEGWNQMKGFILSLDDQDEKTIDLLLTAIEGRGAFRMFKDMIHRFGLQDRWYEYRDRENRREALNWLRSRDLIADEDVEKGIQLYEEVLTARKQRKEDMENMTEGMRVKCIDDAGHAGKLTPGKIYDVVVEQKQHLNIRLRDDDGNLHWYPKSHFELVRE